MSKSYSDIREAVDFMSAGKYTTVMHPKTRKLEKILKTNLKKYVMKGYRHMGPVKNRVTKSMFEEGQIAEAPEDDMPASPDEASMALDQAKFIQYVGKEIEDYIEGNNEFPEWMQNKLTGLHEKAKDMHAVMAGKYESVQKPSELEKLDEAAYKVPNNYAAMKARMNKRKKVTDAQINKVLGPTKNAQQGVEALKKAFKVTDDEAKAMIKHVMPTEETVAEATMYLVKMHDGSKHKKTMDTAAAEKMKKNPDVLSVSVIGNVAEESIEEKLKVSDGMGTWIKDFQDSDAPQFKGKSDKERRDMAIAAYMSAKKESTNEGYKMLSDYTSNKKDISENVDTVIAKISKIKSKSAEEIANGLSPVELKDITRNSAEYLKKAKEKGIKGYTEILKYAKEIHG